MRCDAHAESKRNACRIDSLAPIMISFHSFKYLFVTAMSYSKYHIVFPRGDRSKLTIVEICSGMSYEINDYDVASRNYFYEYDEAAEYGKKLARQNGLSFISSDGEGDYLD